MPRRATVIAAAGVLLLAGAAFLRRDARRFAGAALSELRTFRPRRGPVPLPADAGALGLRPAAFDVPGVGTVRGWWAPSRNGAAVVLAHGSGGDRRDVLDVARGLVPGGYGALLFDWPGHGESDGRVRYGAPERRALRAAVTYVLAQPGVRTDGVGAYGFSMGGHLVTQVAAEDLRVRAVALAAAPDDVLALTRREYASSGRAAQWGAVLADRLAGLRFDDPQPAALVGRLAPRPLLVLTGTADAIVPPAVARTLYAAAGEPKRLWLVEGAGHGGYERVAPGFGAEVRRFYDGALGGAAGVSRRAAP